MRLLETRLLNKTSIQKCVPARSGAASTPIKRRVAWLGHIDGSPSSFAQHASSDVITINATQAGFTACLLCGAVGRVALGPSTMPGVGRWAQGFGGCWP